MATTVGVVVFPGTNCEMDAVFAVEGMGGEGRLLWHADDDIGGVDAVIVPGGFAHGDYLRPGAIARFSPMMGAVAGFAADGGPVLGICNGFQVLTEAGLLPGALMRNAGLRFVCREIGLRVERDDTIFTRAYRQGTLIRLPIAHNEGKYAADAETLARLEGEGLIAFRYETGDNPNGSLAEIAGIFDPARRVLGMMPHPERAWDAALGGTDGAALFDGLARALSG